MTETPKKRIKLAYMGPCLLEGGKAKGSAWLEVESKQKRAYSAKIAKGIRIGAIYSFEMDEKGSIFTASRRFEEVMDKEVRLEWEAEADETSRELEAKRIEEAHKVLLAPLREQYRCRVGYTARAAYLAKIITYITG